MAQASPVKCINSRRLSSGEKVNTEIYALNV